MSKPVPPAEQSTVPPVVELPRPIGCDDCRTPFGPPYAGWQLWPGSGKALCPDCDEDRDQELADDRRRAVAHTIYRIGQVAWSVGFLLAIAAYVAAWVLCPRSRQ